jgi:predicted DNA-binding transcriptional regulator AlpA
MATNTTTAPKSKRREHDKGSLLIDMQALRNDYLLSSSTIFRMVKVGMLPEPVRTGLGRTAKRYWRRDAIEAALAALPRRAAA